MKKVLLALTTAIALFSAVKTNAQSVPGALIVNEISNGANGTKEFAELVAASTAAGSTTVDLTNWIIDDNNGVFNGGMAKAGVGISRGHLRLTNPSTDPTFWQTIPAGALIVLFNAGDYDSTNANFNTAVALGSFFSTTNSTGNNVYYLPVGITNYVQQNSTTPYADSPGNSSYCNAGTYTAPAGWSPIGLSNSCVGDGIQTRCPGCLTNLSTEPSFYSGISYGDTSNVMMHYTNATGTGFDGAHVTLTPGDTTCATAKAFQFYQGTNPGMDVNWQIVSAAAATPGEPNSVANEGYIDSLTAAATRSDVVTACAQPTPPPTTNLGALAVVEISNGPSAGTTSGNCEYAVITVAPCSANPAADSVDIRGWIFDDNAGNFDRAGCASGVGISQGHYRFAYNDLWAKVPVGSSIVVFNADDNCYSLPTATPNANVSGVYYEPISASVTNTNVQRYGSRPSSSICEYCAASGTTTYTAAASWANTVGLSNTGDAFQVRCPGCSDTYPGSPSFYHGFGYGPATGTGSFVSIPVSSGDLGGPVLNTSTGTNKRFFFNPSSVTSSSDLGNASNWASGTAYAAGSAGTIGQYSTPLQTYVTSGTSDFPCCGGAAPKARAAISSKVGNIAEAVNDVSVYPNPATATLNVEFPASDSKTSVKLMDINGRIVASQDAINTTKVTFDLHNMIPGVYTYHVINNNNVKSGKVIIK